MEIKDFNSDVWGPQYWFFLHTVGYSYPKKPNEVRPTPSIICLGSVL